MHQDIVFANVLAILTIRVSILHAIDISINKCCSEGESFGFNLTCIPDDRSQEKDWQFRNANSCDSYINFTINYNRSIECVIDSISKVSAHHLKSGFFYENGGMILTDSNVTYAKKEYCVETNFWNLTVILTCPCSKHLCIRKCCPRRNLLMQSINNPLRNSYFCNNSKIKEFHYSFMKGARNYSHFGINYGKPKCKDGKKLYIIRRRYELMSNGSLKLPKHFLNTKDYCADYLLDEKRKLKILVYACVKRRYETDWFFFGSNITSVLISVITILLLRFAERMSRISYLIYLGHFATLTLAYITIAMGQFDITARNVTVCLTVGYTMQFSFLASFFWLNVMCLDMSWTFSAIRPPSFHKNTHRKKFIIYSIYAWGGPLSLTLAVIGVEYSPILSKKIFLPSVGVIDCFFKSQGTFWIYFGGPIMILLFLNLILFIYTTYKIVMLRKVTQALRQNNGATHSNKAMNDKDTQTFWLYGKLFFFMGVTWLSEVITWIFLPRNHMWWYFTDVINLSRSVFVFIIFCCKPKVWIAITKRIARFKSLCCNKHFNEEAKSPTTSNIEITKF